MVKRINYARLFITGALSLVGIMPIQALAFDTVHFLQEKAIYLQNEGQIGAAASTWKQLLLIDPKNPKALGALALLNNELGKKEESKTYLDKLRTVAPGSSQIPNIVSVLNQTPRYGELLKKASKLLSSGDYVEAVNTYNEAFGGREVPPSLASGYFNALDKVPGGKTKAISDLQTLVKNNPTVGEYGLILGQLLTYDPTDRGQGIQILSKLALTNEPQAEQARQSWRQALIWEGSNQSAIPLLEQYLRHYKSNTLNKQLTEAKKVAIAAYQGKIQKAKSLQETLIFDKEKSGYDALHQGNLIKAEQIFKNLISTNPKEWHYYGALADVYLAERHYAEAIQVYQQESEIAPGSQKEIIAGLIKQAQGYTVAHLAQEAVSSGEYALAEHYYNRILVNNPQSRIALEGLAGLYSNQKNYVKAVETYRKAVSVNPNSVSLWIGLMQTLHAANMNKTALDTLQSLPSNTRLKAEQKADYWATLGSVYAGLKDYIRSQEAFQRALSLSNQNNPDVQLQLGWVLYNSGAYQALNQLLPKIKSETLSSNQQSQLAKLELVQDLQKVNSAIKDNDFAQARLILNRLENKFPDNQTVLTAINNSRLLEAWQLYKKPGTGQVLYKLLVELHSTATLTPSQTQQVSELFEYGADREGQNLVKENQFQGAAAVYRNMQKLFPENKHYTRQLAGVYLAAGQKEDAYTLFKQVGPGNASGSYAAAVGTAFAAGHLGTASTWAKEGLVKWPDSQTLIKLAAQLAEAQGNTLEALDYYQKLLHTIPKENKEKVGPSPINNAEEPLPPFAGG